MADLVVDSPYTLEESVRLPYADGAAIEGVLDRARAAARSFRSVPIAERVVLVLDAVLALEAKKDAIAAGVTATVGKPLKQAKGEMGGTAKRARHMAHAAEFALHDATLPKLDGFERRIARVPLGVVFALPAWNYPLLTAVNVVMPAVLAGNAVVLKHSPRSPTVGAAFAEAFKAAGAPVDLVQSIVCDYDAAEKIAGDARIDHVAFTGSVLGGHKIYAAAAKSRFIEVGLELGGKDGAYVAADADLDRAVENIVDGACYNAGQSCCAVERAYVHRDLYDKFVEACRVVMKGYVLGDPNDDKTNMGPIAQPWHPEFIQKQIDQAKAKGAKVLLGGKALSVNGKGRFFEPTLITGASADLDVMRVETFGPVLPIVPVDSDEEALALINDSAYGLTASIWTKDQGRAEKMARDLEVGTVYMNQCDTLDPALPWTGVKDSGKGSTLSTIGFDHLTRPKALNFKR